MSENNSDEMTGLINENRRLYYQINRERILELRRSSIYNLKQTSAFPKQASPIIHIRESYGSNPNKYQRIVSILLGSTDTNWIIYFIRFLRKIARFGCFGAENSNPTDIFYNCPFCFIWSRI